MNGEMDCFMENRKIPLLYLYCYDGVLSNVLDRNCSWINVAYYITETRGCKLIFEKGTRNIFPPVGHS